MTLRSTEQLVAELADGLEPARPLAPPWRRAMTALLAIALAGGLVILLFAEPATFGFAHRDDEAMMVLEVAAILATAITALLAAFFAAIPGRSRAWLAAPLLPLAAWILFSGLGCYGEMISGATGSSEAHHSMDCFLFITGASLPLAIPVLWLLARARPIAPLPVAALGALGVAAIAAFLLQFFHPFALTFVDFGLHIAAVLVVVGAASLMNRRLLAPA